MLSQIIGAEEDEGLGCDRSVSVNFPLSCREVWKVGSVFYFGEALRTSSRQVISLIFC